MSGLIELKKNGTEKTSLRDLLKTLKDKDVTFQLSAERISGTVHLVQTDFVILIGKDGGAGSPEYIIPISSIDVISGNR